MRTSLAPTGSLAFLRMFLRNFSISPDGDC